MLGFTSSMAAALGGSQSTALKSSMVLAALLLDTGQAFYRHELTVLRYHIWIAL
jgi:hypothetical protein